MTCKPEIHTGKPGIELDAPFVDERGRIQPLLEHRIESAAIVHSKRGATRANHYHRTDGHYAYVISGRIEYYHRPTGSDASPQREEYVAGEMFFSPPMVDHTMYFPEDTSFLVMALKPRDHESYENDVVRIPDLREAKP